MIKFLFNLIFIFSLFSCASNESKVKAIAIYDLSEEHDYVMIFANNSAEIDSSISKGKIYENRELATEYVKVKKVITDSAIMKLADLFTAECNEKTPIQTNSEPVLYIKVITKDNVQTCYNYSKENDSLIKHLNDLKLKLENSSFHNEYNPILSYIENKINILNEAKSTK